MAKPSDSKPSDSDPTQWIGQKTTEELAARIRQFQPWWADNEELPDMGDYSELLAIAHELADRVVICEQQLLEARRTPFDDD